ncbi:MAG: caspase family protein [Gammaproteobacteria bacterium]|nr:caspase family protein [Gammaproteobacteria bacterium]
MPSLVPEIYNQPATHVLVIGVSAYRHFDDGTEPTNNGDLLNMAQLSAAARSASEFAAWMLKKYSHQNAELGSLRVLLSPSDNEVIHADISAHGAKVLPATLANVEQELIAFRKLCDRNPQNVAVVYVAGHGVQITKSGSILLLHDCGSDNHATLLKGAIDMASVRAGFNHANTAQTQFWFVDACRQEPDVAERFEDMDGGLRLDEPSGSASGSALFLAATTGKPAYARIKGITLFWEGLQWGLNGGMAVEPEDGVSENWHVSAHGLNKKLKPRVSELAEAENAEQLVDSEIRFEDALFHEFVTIPKVDVTFDVSPAAAAAGSQGTLSDENDQPIMQTVNLWPMSDKVDAGIYKLKIVPPAPFRPYSKFETVKPPAVARQIDVSP